MKNKVGRVGLVLIIMMSSFAGVLSVIPKEVLAYTPHDPISIVGNDEFAAQALNEGWAGDGTEGNPYIIEGYEIHGNWWEAIEIISCDVYFIIRNSLITYGEISLEGITNGSIINCTLNGRYTSISLNSSHGNDIIENTFTNQSWSCLYLTSSNYNYISNNTLFSQYGKGISIKNSNWNAFLNNTLAGRNGIDIQNSIGILMSNNTMKTGDIKLAGEMLEHWNTHNISHSNLIEGKPIYYWKN